MVQDIFFNVIGAGGYYKNLLHHSSALSSIRYILVPLLEFMSAIEPSKRLLVPSGGKQIVCRCRLNRCGDYCVTA